MRWLEMQDKHDQVVNVLKRIATVNKKDLPNLENNIKLEVINLNSTNFLIIIVTISTLFLIDIMCFSILI